jgi:hypothetical protein
MPTFASTEAIGSSLAAPTTMPQEDAHSSSRYRSKRFGASVQQCRQVVKPANLQHSKFTQLMWLY